VQGDNQRAAFGPHGSAEIDEGIAVTERPGMRSRGELIDATLDGAQQPACCAQPSGNHLGGGAQPQLLGEQRQFVKGNQSRLT
jgi:hypothetical protein